MMQFTDSHLHLQDYKTNNALQIITDLRSKGFVRVVCVSDRPDSWKKTARLAEEYPEMVIPAFGLHPWYLAEAPENWLEILRGYLLKFPKAQIGECGLDRLKAPSEEGQMQAFSAQIGLAKELGRPVNIHALKADEWLGKMWAEMPQKFMLHSFGGSVELLRKALASGAYISLSAAVLRRKNYAALIRETPLNRLLLESDGPYLSDYKEIPAFSGVVAEIKNMPQDKLVAAVYANFKEFNREN